MQLKKKGLSIIKKLPYIKGLYREIERLKAEELNFNKNSCVPAGHYYSPIISVDDIKKRESEIWCKANEDYIIGIKLRTKEQIELFESFARYINEVPFSPEKQANFRYQYDNDFYGYTDAVILYSMIRHFKPQSIIEIGSGYSSAVMLDTNESFFEKSIKLTFIEPSPERLFSLMNEDDKKQTTIIQGDVQSINLDSFARLKSGDILFIDSTHIAKTGSDVNYILFEILPALKSGVLIHFHDVTYPFEYPIEWVYLGRNWNEAYILKAFLMYNNNFEILLFSDFLHRHHKELFRNMPLSNNDPGMNLWLMKK